MLTEPLIQQLQLLRLRGMATGLEQLRASRQDTALDFDECLSLLIQHELTDRQSKRLAQRLRWAKLPQSAALEDLDTRTPRGLDARLVAQLATLAWIKDRLNVLVTGPCGVGKPGSNFDQDVAEEIGENDVKASADGKLHHIAAGDLDGREFIGRGILPGDAHGDRIIVDGLDSAGAKRSSGDGKNSCACSEVEGSETRGEALCYISEEPKACGGRGVLSRAECHSGRDENAGNMRPASLPFPPGMLVREDLKFSAD